MEDLEKPLPLQSFRFLIRIGDNDEIVGAFSRISGIKMTVETIEGRAGNDNRGVKEATPVFTRFEPVTMSKGVIGSSDFLDWLLSSSADMHSGPTGKNLKRSIEVIALNDKGKPGVMWTLQNAMPIGYELSPMDGGRSEVLTESVTFAITGIKREIPPAEE